MGKGRQHSRAMDARYEVRSDAGQPLTDDSAVLDALQRLRDVLNMLPDPVAACASELVQEDVRRMMAPMTIQMRTAVLGIVGMKLAPRALGDRLCDDILSRVRRSGPGERRFALSKLSGRAWSAMVHTVALGYRLQPQHPQITLQDRWSPAVLRTALWTNLNASTDSAFMWQWAVSQSWWLPDALSPEHGQQVLAATNAVLTLLDHKIPSFAATHMVPNKTAAFQDDEDTYPRDDSEEADEPPDDRARDARRADAVPNSERATGPAAIGVPEPERPAPAKVKQPVIPADTDPAPVERPDQLLDHLAGLRDELDVALREALTVSLPLITNDLLAGSPPPPMALAELAQLRDRFAFLAEALSERVGKTVEATMPAFDTTLADLARHAAVDQTRDSIRGLQALTHPQGTAVVLGQLGALCAVVEQILTTEVWTAEDQRTADGLLALAEMMEMNPASGQVDLPRLVDLQTRTSQHLPPSCSMLPMSALTGQLVLGAVGLTSLPATEQQEIIQAVPDITDDRAPAAAGDNPANDPEADAGQPAGQQGSERSSPQREGISVVPRDLVVTKQKDDAPGADTDKRGTRKTGIDDISTVIPQVIESVPDRERMAALVGDQRYGAAAVVARKLGMNASYERVLRLAALADAARSGTGPCASQLNEELVPSTGEDITVDGITRMLGVPALLRAAIITGQPDSGALLSHISSHLETNLGAIASDVGRRAVANVFSGGALRIMLNDIPALERRLAEAQKAAIGFNRSRRLRFQRATEIAKRWLAHDGLLGTMLDAAATDDRNAAADTAATIGRLADHNEVDRELDKLDGVLRGRGGKPLEGSGRQDLVNLVTEVRQPISQWVEAVLAVTAHTHRAGRTWAVNELADMRTAVLARADAALKAINDVEHTDSLANAAAHAATASLSTTFALLNDATALAGDEAPAGVVLTVELLKVPGASAAENIGQVSLPDGITASAILDALDTTWAHAVRAQLAGENYRTARYLLDLATHRQLPSRGEDPAELAADLRTELASAEKASINELSATSSQLFIELRRARLQNEVSEEQDGELTSMLHDADPNELGGLCSDLAVIRAQLGIVGQLLPEYRDQAGLRLIARLQGLPDRDVEHIRRVIDDGQLSTAEELIYYSEIGEQVPSTQNVRTDLRDFFPAVPGALRDGITDEVLAAVRDGRAYAGLEQLDFSGLSADARKDAADALTGWRIVRVASPDSRNRLNEQDSLLPALRLVGLEARKIRQLPIQKSKDRRFVEIGEVTINGKAMVPAFGSKLGGRLHALLVWGQPNEDLLLSYADHDKSGQSLLILYFGTLSPAARRRLARRVIETSAPVVVLDDAALAYLAAHGDRQLDSTMAITLPFSRVNPYVGLKRGLVAEEMFYGRTLERNSVIDVDGTQILFGGRGLGKSALLRSSAGLFETEPERIALYLDLNAVGIGPRALTPDALWDILLRELVKREVVAAQSSRAARRGSTEAHEAVRAGVLDWLEQDNRRCLLILLDESDHFFEADAPSFLQTNRLKDLGPASQGRAKVVFAGLHTVQRFAKANNNGPFSHLGRPTVIGPLRPQPAFNLITKPMEALGYVFARDGDLVNRILGYCSYQPFLLQMFAHRLIEVILERRLTESDESSPPYRVTRSDIEAVESDPQLRADITGAFRDTLNLDARYNVIANVLAHNAHEHGMDDRLNDVELRDECLTWWHDGFSQLSVEHFRAYLQEMVGLGVLAPNNGAGWHLRSPNVLRMIGPPDDVTTELVQAESASVPDTFIALETRPLLPDGDRSPLTAGQIDDLLGDHNTQTRLVLGSEATGIGNAYSAVRQVIAEMGSRYTLLAPTTRKTFVDELVSGVPGQRRVVLSSLVGMREDGCAASLKAALDMRPETRGVTRSAVLIAGADSISWWRQALSARSLAGLGAVALQRFTPQTLKVWSLSEERFTTEDKRDELLRVSGGWPSLVQAASTVASGSGDEPAAITALEDQLSSPAGAAAFIATTGLLTDPEISLVFDELLGLIDDGAALADLLSAVGMVAPHLDAGATVAALLALGVLDLGIDEKYRCERVVATCWPHRTREPEDMNQDGTT